ncbi:MAG: DUF1302 family protein, partial [Spirochaetes bacterium]|nr:DUF1302 family protein [Spirochaetota bacterium]
MVFRKTSVHLFMLVAVIVFPLASYAYNIPISESSFIEFKGDLTYAVKVKTEDPDPELVGESKGNSNFEKGDLINNKGIVKLEVKFDSTYLTLFGNGHAAYDYVMDDDDKYPEGTDIDEAKKHSARVIELQEYYLDFHVEKFTLRAGR